MALYKSEQPRRTHFFGDTKVEFVGGFFFTEDPKLIKTIDESIQRHKNISRDLGIEKVPEVITKDAEEVPDEPKTKLRKKKP